MPVKKAKARRAAKRVVRKTTSSAKKGAKKVVAKARSAAKSKPSQARRSLQSVRRVAVGVAHQAQSAVSEGVGALREMGENLVERVTG